PHPPLLLPVSYGLSRCWLNEDPMHRFAAYLPGRRAPAAPDPPRLSRSHHWSCTSFPSFSSPLLKAYCLSSICNRNDQRPFPRARVAGATGKDQNVRRFLSASRLHSEHSRLLLSPLWPP